MCYAKKIQNLVWKLHEANNESKNDAYAFILGTHLDNLLDYAKRMIDAQLMQPVLKDTLNDAEYYNAVRNNDEIKQTALDSAVSSIDALNKLSERFGLEPFMSVNTTDKQAVSEAIGKLLMECTIATLMSSLCEPAPYSSTSGAEVGR